MRRRLSRVLESRGNARGDAQEFGSAWSRGAVEFRGEDATVPIKPLHKMTKQQIMKELPANGFKLVEQFDKLPWQHLMFFEVGEASK